MNKNLTFGLLGLMLSGTASAGDGLYAVGLEPEDSFPLALIAGADLIYDDNVKASGTNEEDSLAINPYIGATLQSISPQTMVELYAKFGMLYYFDAPNGVDDWVNNSMLKLNVRHNLNERLGLVSNNMISYDLEPNYAYGVASGRGSEEHYTWSSNNYIAYSWTERLGTRTGFNYGGVDYVDSDNSNRLTTTVFNQFRYSLQPVTVLTAEYKYGTSTGSGVSSDSTNQFLLVGVEQRFSPNTVGVFNIGAQFRDVDRGSDSTSPYVSASLRSNVNEQLTVSAFVRYGIEDSDTVQLLNDGSTVEYDERKTLRIGVDGSYKLSPVLSFNGGINYVPTNFTGGRLLSGTGASDVDETLVNAYIGLSMQLTESVIGTATYNYTNSDSDVSSRDYDRNRISLGVKTQF